MKNYRYDLESIACMINQKTKIIYLANPDNPTGTYFAKKEFEKFMSIVPERVLVIMDEAYFEFAQSIDDFPDSMSYRYDNVITLRTFSKSYGLAGFRVGYGFAHHHLIENLLKDYIKHKCVIGYRGFTPLYNNFDNFDYNKKKRNN